MSYDPDSLWALTYVNGMTVWSYKTPDRASEVTAPGYFRSDQLRAGDFIYLTASRYAQIEGGVLLVTDMSARVATVAPLTEICSSASPTSEAA